MPHDPVTLSVAELRCLALAWEAWGQGSVPVGAVVVDPDGTVMFEGRSRMYERTAPPGQLAGSLLAHAEVNALLRLDPGSRHHSLTLVTTLEPCPLCLGAVGMATVGSLVYLGADPYGGAVGLHRPTPHLLSLALSVAGPHTGAPGVLASALHVAFYLLRNPGGRVLAVHRERAPEVVAAAERLLGSEADVWAREGRSLDDALPTLLSLAGV